MGDWAVHLTDEVTSWLAALAGADQETARHVRATIRLLRSEGPALGRPYADTVKGSRIKNLKELLPPSPGGSDIRILFCFDPRRQAILLIAGDKAAGTKSDRWRRWYRETIPVAERLYEEHLKNLEEGRP